VCFQFATIDLEPPRRFRQCVEAGRAPVTVEQAVVPCWSVDFAVLDAVVFMVEPPVEPHAYDQVVWLWPLYNVLLLLAILAVWWVRQTLDTQARAQRQLRSMLRKTALLAAFALVVLASGASQMDGVVRYRDDLDLYAAALGEARACRVAPSDRPFCFEFSPTDGAGADRVHRQCLDDTGALPPCVFEAMPCTSVDFALLPALLFPVAPPAEATPLAMATLIHSTGLFLAAMAAVMLILATERAHHALGDGEDDCHALNMAPMPTWASESAYSDFAGDTADGGMSF